MLMAQAVFRFLTEEWSDLEQISGELVCLCERSAVIRPKDRFCGRILGGLS